MDLANSIWIAKLLGPVIVALSIPMITAPGQLTETTERFLANPALILVTGVLAMTTGLAIVNSHNHWVWGWPVIVTLFGWVLTIGGLVRIVLPQLVMNVAMPVARTMGVVWGVLGLFIAYKGYFS